jgi:hypothetical protein
LQKQHSKALGFLHHKALEGKVAAGHVLIAEGADDEARPSGSAIAERDVAVVSPTSPAAIALPDGRASWREPLGYVIGNDRYYKRDDVGAVFQMAVVPKARRGLVAATLLKSLFERAAYGCKLYCCWCAKDLDANRFWEAMGFVPIAFRAGGRGRKCEVGMRNAEVVNPKYGLCTSTFRIPTSHIPRIHIFWQKRIRQSDTETPWWYPYKTAGGAIGQDRIVLPIPPGVHWSDIEAAPLPEEFAGEQPKLPGRRKPRAKKVVRPALPKETELAAGGLRFRPRAEEARSGELVASRKAEPEPEKVAKPKFDPKLEAYARELRDRWQERVAEEPWMVEGRGKYDVTRQIEASPDRRRLAA